ncbi:L-arginine-binding protein-like [Glandiceps talaboti]
MAGEQLERHVIDELERQTQYDKIYTFSTSLFCDCAGQYIDDRGEIAGFTIDLVNEVCKEAGKKCQIVFDEGTRCHTHRVGEHSGIGRGLLSNAYDACLSWTSTSEREHSLRFSRPYSVAATTGHFYVKNGNPKGFDPIDIHGKQIGHLDTWFTDAFCLLQYYNVVHRIGQSEQPHFENSDMDILLQRLEDNKIDAAFLPDYLGVTGDGLEVVGQAIECGSGFWHVMTRKDSDVIPWFDRTLKHMQMSGQYYKLCLKAHNDHGHKGTITCVDHET